jgi:glycosyltransferase involved in cell wall biosynthesis
MLKSLREMLIPADLFWELIVVDNNSSDGTKTVVEKFQNPLNAKVRYIFESQPGQSYARNAGVREAQGNIIAFTDDDTRVDPLWLLNVKNAFDQFDCMGLGGKVIPIWPCKTPPWVNVNGPYRIMNVIPSFDYGNEPIEIKTPPFGANMAFKKVAFEKYNLFRTDLGPIRTIPTPGDDTEFGRRLIRGGERIIYTPNAIVYHPVDKERATKKYFCLWYFRYGRSSIRIGLIPAIQVNCLWLPALLFRGLLANFLRWTATFNSHRRFYYKLELFRVIGQITELFCPLKKSPLAHLRKEEVK